MSIAHLLQNIMLNTALISCAWDDMAKIWSLQVLEKGKMWQLTCSYLVMALGAGGQKPLMPEYPNKVSENLQSTKSSQAI